MVLVVRRELRLSAGKAAVQVAHAAVMLTRLAERRDSATLEAWLGEGQMKIALGVPTLSDLEALERAARARKKCRPARRPASGSGRQRRPSSTR
jgi:PTH2 family peptidyl-tRNA hydrolase